MHTTTTYQLARPRRSTEDGFRMETLPESASGVVSSLRSSTSRYIMLPCLRDFSSKLQPSARPKAVRARR